MTNSRTSLRLKLGAILLLCLLIVVLGILPSHWRGAKGTGDKVDIKLYDANFETTGKVIDTFSSLSYTDRWNADGDFKLVLPVGDYNTVKDAKYLSVDGRTFEISQINTADASASNELTISGHNLNVLLDRVVITTPARIQGNLEEQIRTLVSVYRSRHATRLCESDRR